MADSRPPTEDELEPVEEPPVTELEREERRLERLRLVTSQWPVPNRFSDFGPDPRETA